MDEGKSATEIEEILNHLYTSDEYDASERYARSNQNKHFVTPLNQAILLHSPDLDFQRSGHACNGSTHSLYRAVAVDFRQLTVATIVFSQWECVLVMNSQSL